MIHATAVDTLDQAALAQMQEGDIVRGQNHGGNNDSRCALNVHRGVGAQKCAVPLCTNTSNSIPISERFCKLHKCIIGQLHCDCTPPLAFFAFPSKLEDRVRWIKLIRRTDLLMNGQFDSMNTHHVCCQHFPDSKPTDANPDPVINLEQMSDSEKDDKLKTPSEKITPTDKTPPPKEPVITEKRQRKTRRSKELALEPSSSESDSNESDSDSSSDTEGRVYCKCGEPNTENMIGCDGKKCENEWFHFKCVGIANRKKVPRGKWYCDDCSGKQKETENSPIEWKQKLKQICREIMTKKITIQSASQAYGISQGMLTNHLHSEPILTTHEEQRLVEMALSMANQGHGTLVKQSILNSVKVLLDVEEKMGIKRFHPFEKNLPRNEWWFAFCKRHPQVRELKLHKRSAESALDKLKKQKGEVNSRVVMKEKENKNAGKQSKTPLNSNLKRKTPPETNDIDDEKKHKMNKMKTFQPSSDPTHKRALDIDGKPNALQCLEEVLVKKQRHLFQHRFKNGIECEYDVVYAAWRALKLLYSDPTEDKQDNLKNPPVPQTEGDIPPWSPCRRGPFYIPDESSKTSVSLLVSSPGKKRRKRVMSRITSMKAKKRGHYLEPWRFGVCNRKVFKPWKNEMKKRSRRKRFVTKRFEGYY